MYRLKVNEQRSMIALHEQGWSRRRIARELGLDRGTVGKYLAGNPKPATHPHTGSEEAGPSKPATNPHTGSTTLPGPASLCDPWQEQIQEGLEQGLSIQRIYQDLVVQRQFAGSYYECAALCCVAPRAPSLVLREAARGGATRPTLPEKSNFADRCG